ncbi:bacteriohemerythrin [bacterium]|nr:MAG: bacteriohemerythrin [bacterium]
MVLNWMEYFNTGVEVLDNHHKELFRRISNLHEAMSENKGHEEIVPLLDFFDRYVVLHFSEEERLMSAHNYPDAGAHKTQHEQFKDENARMNRDAKHGVDLVHILNLNDKATDWLINHIGKTDQHLGCFLKVKIQI